MRKLRNLSVVAVLAIAGTALAATVTEKGKIVGASKSSVTARVTIRGGKPTKISSIAFKAVPSKCDGGSMPQNVRVTGVGIVAADGRFQIRTTVPGGPGGFIAVKGKVAADGKSASGSLSFDVSNPPPAGECKATNKRWKIKAG